MKQKESKKVVDKKVTAQKSEVFTPELSKSQLSKKITKTHQNEIIEQRKHKLQ
jgi:hypothetical protein